MKAAQITRNRRDFLSYPSHIRRSLYAATYLRSRLCTTATGTGNRCRSSSRDRPPPTSARRGREGLRIRRCERSLPALRASHLGISRRRQVQYRPPLSSEGTLGTALVLKVPSNERT